MTKGVVIIRFVVHVSFVILKANPRVRLQADKPEITFFVLSGVCIVCGTWHVPLFPAETTTRKLSYVLGIISSKKRKNINVTY